MAEVIGVKFRYAGKMYYFGAAGETFVRGDKVIVETARGREMGNVIAGNREVPDEEIVQPLKDIIRKATDEDLMSARDFMDKEKDAFVRCREKIRERGLDMKLVEAEYTYDGSKVIFYFTADGRVDFRELVKDLASMFKTRIELRQIGIRDEAMIRGGYGSCGRSLCCASYLNDFVPVSIKMAKEQNLSLNPTKISGVCGRLMCCLKNEEDTYEFLNSQMPRIGEMVEHKIDRVKGTVIELSVLKQKVKVKVEDGDSSEVVEYPVSELTFKYRGKGCPMVSQEESPEEEAELEALEALEESEEQAREDEEEVAGGRRRDRSRRNRRNDRPAEGDRQERRREENYDHRQDDKKSDEEGRNHHRRDRHRNRPETDGQSSTQQKSNVPAGSSKEASSGKGKTEGQAASQAGGQAGEGQHRRHRNHHGHHGHGGNKPEGAAAESQS